ncbi:MAG: amidohydrolase family protein [Bryobacterales bacterium]|nr:amidohydrolase family protein [Bryobacterales bacterium]
MSPVRDEDREFFARELNAFVPPRVFDAHIHLYRVADFRGAVPTLAAAGPPVAGWAAYEAAMEELTPGRQYRALAFPFPAAGVDLAAANAFVASQPLCHGQMLVTPEMDPEFVRESVRRHGFVGLKCYHVFSRREPTWDSTIEEYMPDRLVRVAHEEGLTITLHLVKERALADPVNQESLRRLARRYPDARWILAHAARGFNVHHTIAGIESLRGLSNVWCDTSAVTECGAFEAIVRTLGVERLLYGSDFPVSHIRGRCVAIGDSFLWLTEENTQFNAAHAPLRPVLVGLESLRALKQACWNLDLPDSAVERIFHGNAAQLFGEDAA